MKPPTIYGAELSCPQPVEKFQRACGAGGRGGGEGAQASPESPGQGLPVHRRGGFRANCTPCTHGSSLEG